MFNLMKAASNWCKNLGGREPLDLVQISEMVIIKGNLKFIFNDETFQKQRYYLAIPDSRGDYYEFFSGTKIKYTLNELTSLKMNGENKTPRKHEGIYNIQTEYLISYLNEVIHICKIERKIGKSNPMLTDEELFRFIERVNLLLDDGYDFFTMYSYVEEEPQ